jgi:hypothetical protein
VENTGTPDKPAENLVFRLYEIGASLKGTGAVSQMAIEMDIFQGNQAVSFGICILEQMVKYHGLSGL